MDVSPNLPEGKDSPSSEHLQHLAPHKAQKWCLRETWAITARKEKSKRQKLGWKALRSRYIKQLSELSVWSPRLDVFHTKDNTKVTAKEDRHYVIRELSASNYSRSYFKLKHAGVCSCSCSHKQKAYILETVLLCLFVTAQGILYLAASGTILLEASPGPLLSLRTVGSKWGGKWDAWCTPEALCLDSIMRQRSLWALASWAMTLLCGWKNGDSLGTAWKHSQRQDRPGLHLPSLCQACNTFSFVPNIKMVFPFCTWAN